MINPRAFFTPLSRIQRRFTMSNAFPSGHKQTESTVSMADTIVNAPSTIRTSKGPNSTRIYHNPNIPHEPHPAGKNLVVLFDGTGDQFDSENSNIVKMASLLAKNDQTKQMFYYQPGFGTYTSPEMVNPFMANIVKKFDEAVAFSLGAHLMNGYEFLMQHYVPGDRICLFGFSRGAYTARALAGMLHKVGLLLPGNYQQVPFAYVMYQRDDVVGWNQSNAFKRTFGLNVPIHFLGVWDTVNSVGLLGRNLPFTASNTAVHTFRHAVSLDEHRAKFQPNLYNFPSPEELSLTLHSKQKQVLSQSAFVESLEARSTETDRKEVWFAGCHCDIGGGSVLNTTANDLARIPLRWMIRECFRTNSGIIFDKAALHTVGLDPARLEPDLVHLPRPPPLPTSSLRLQNRPSSNDPPPLEELQLKGFMFSDGIVRVPEPPEDMEEQEELKDALSPIYDQLVLAPMWNLLEWIPFRVDNMGLKGKAGTSYWPNFRKARNIPKQTEGFHVHRSVKMRMEAMAAVGGTTYKPGPQFDVEPIWVD